MAHDPLIGAIVAAQSRCQGYLCPNWAMDVSRYDTIRYQDTEQFEYTLSENLPLGPTSEREFETYTAYSESSRLFASVAADYSVGGVDSYWMHKISNDILSTIPVYTNVMIAHADTSPDNPGTTHVVRILFAPNDQLVALFSDGTIHNVDLENKNYNQIGSLYSTFTSNSHLSMTYAHVFDGNTLKSFVLNNEDGNTYLVKVDFVSTNTITVSQPLKITYLKGMELVTPINALMISSNDNEPLQLTVVLAGSFDQINYVNETTGEVIALLTNMYESAMAVFECYESTKDCDFWTTAGYDRLNHLLYIQAHVHDSSGTSSTTMLKVGFTQSKINQQWYPYVNTAMWPMNFGYSGYQYVAMV